jgi:hypothetical protein
MRVYESVPTQRPWSSFMGVDYLARVVHRVTLATEAQPASILEAGNRLHQPATAVWQVGSCRVGRVWSRTRLHSRGRVSLGRPVGSRCYVRHHRRYPSHAIQRKLPTRSCFGSGRPLRPRVPSGRRYWWTMATKAPLGVPNRIVWLRVQKGSFASGGLGWPFERTIVRYSPFI